MSDSLQQRFYRYVCRHRLFSSGGKGLIAVSGGVDSMTLLHLWREAGFRGEAAHCNFGLRGEDSDGDEAFVREQAAALDFPVHTVRFDTAGYAAQNGISIQMAARELRYRWFDGLAAGRACDSIALAHHRDDRIETLFINLARGTGVKGMTGMPVRRGKIIRPLLFASREEIIDYARNRQIAFREDASNASDKYARNYIRHHLVAGMEKFFPGFRKTVERDMANFEGMEAFYREAVGRFRRKAVRTDGELLYVDLHELLKSPSPVTLLFEILQPFGFAGSVAEEVLDDPFRAGRRFYSDTHRLFCDRQKLVLHAREETCMQEYPVNIAATELQYPVRLSIRRFDMPDGYAPDARPEVACMDGDLLGEPLALRRWRPGDRFCPLGMKHEKKLSDFLIDRKLSLLEKERVWVLTSAGQIAWVAAHRIDDRYKVTPNTKRVIQLEIGNQ
ncbi:MAG: tRNA lysidine(34) synthetase TilS [Bacteroidales bacterium]|jgi:tRNA(Ile)-lysidine synthase|nr:tRNA lysidine(34) synthetase TilS [Bacteroidales bacterium]